MPEALGDSKVCGLMEAEQNRWDEDILVDICNERDNALIRKIPLLVRDVQDSWLWLLDDKGVHSKKLLQSFTR